MSLHWVNDLPGLLAQVRHCLAADGLLLAAFPGGETLHELRQALLAAELDVTGGAGLRLSPMIDVRDAGALLQRAGFALPVADVERLTVRYAEPLRLLMDLRAMGEEKGDIMVCRMTNPGWIISFSKIAGLVTDTGGALSHPAVVSREFGIPCVVGTTRATSFIKTGDRVRVNGDTGVVEILD